MNLKISVCLMATISMMVPLIVATSPNLAIAQEAKKEHSMMKNTSIDHIGISQITTSITEWIGLGVLTITTAVLLLFGNNIIVTKNANNRNSYRIMATKVSMVDKGAHRRQR